MHEPVLAWEFEIVTGDDYHAGTSGTVDIRMIGTDADGHRLETTWIGMKSNLNIKSISGLAAVSHGATKWMKKTNLDVDKHKASDISGITNVFGRGGRRVFRIDMNEEQHTLAMRKVHRILIRLRPAAPFRGDNEDWMLEEVNVTDCRDMKHYW